MIVIWMTIYECLVLWQSAVVSQNKQFTLILEPDLWCSALLLAYCLLQFTNYAYDHILCPQIQKSTREYDNWFHRAHCILYYTCSTIGRLFQIPQAPGYEVWFTPPQRSKQNHTISFSEISRKKGWYWWRVDKSITCNSCPASSIAVERSFSVQGYILSPIRDRLTNNDNRS